MKVVVVISCLLALASAGGLMAQTGKNCDASLNLFTMNSFDVTPWPPHKNTNLVMVMSGTMNQAETLKSMEIFVIYNGANFYHESVAESGTYAAGATANITFKVYLPFIAPSGNYGVQVKLTNTAGAFLNCWEVDFTL
ncbi:hypothetical protein SteCoe_11128 [Stentor coeruleus]|uniref:MD-2-related lipid-recognition domain-containing protein n=1 Tax=Stentor coeruleus TaxID=5963 RepID=A0A1R2CDX6_9CILI|nr:hypothetical protein SteCoe_11128 [Stentor coeruleus]